MSRWALCLDGIGNHDLSLEFANRYKRHRNLPIICSEKYAAATALVCKIKNRSAVYIWENTVIRESQLDRAELDNPGACPSFNVIKEDL